MKRILILGAGAAQLSLIQKAAEMGLYVIVSSSPGSYPGFRYANKYYTVDTTDLGGILHIAETEQIDGIVTTGTDVAVRSIGYVNTALKLSGISWESAQLVTDKAKMKRAMYNGGVRTAPYETVYELDEAVCACRAIGLPVMLKCTDQAASKGISKVTDETGIESAYRYAFSGTHNPYIVVEKFVAGQEAGLDGYVSGDGIIIIPHNKKTIQNGRTDVPLGHSLPFSSASEVYEDIINQAELCVRAMGLERCFFNMDFIISGGQCYILEVGGRAGSTCIPELLSLYTGTDYYEKMLQNALGEPVVLRYSPQCACAAQFVTSNRNGVVSELALEPDGTIGDTLYQLDIKPGDRVNRFRVGSDRIGQVIATGASEQACLQKLTDALDFIGQRIGITDG